MREKASDSHTGYLYGDREPFWRKPTEGCAWEMALRGLSLMLIDEPTRGIDVGSKVEIYELIKELVENNIAILMISSEMPELMGVCDRIAVMHEGRLTGILDREEFSEERIMAYASGQTVQEG